MSVSKQEYYVVACDGCGEKLDTGEYGGFTVYESLTAAHEAAREAGWKVYDDGTTRDEECAAEFDAAQEADGA